LLVLNLYSYVDNPFTSGAKFNFKLFRQHVDYAQRLLDDLIDLEIEKIDRIIEKIENDDDKDDDKTIELNLWNKIKKKAIEGRRTGLGITAEGDMLAALGLIYGTDSAINFSENLHKILAIESYKSSIQMAKERGPFPIWNYDKEKSNPFIQRIIRGMSLREDEPTYEMEDLLVISDYKQYGRRNIANLTIAPTGSVSILTQTTSGIEPVFKVSYKRRRKVTEKDKATFIDEVGDMWEEYNVFHHKFIDWYYKSNLNRDLSNSYLKERFECEKFLNQLSDEALNEIIKKSPYYKATSEDVDYLGKVEMQGKIQKWIDHSISVTVNMPKDVTEQMVSDVYMKAYKTGCKGLTVYRDGSRSGVLVSNDKKEEVFPEERPREVMCEINHLTIQGVKWIVIVGILNNKPYEVFCLKDQEILKKYKTGKLIKVKSRVYDLQVDDDGTIHNIVGEFTNPLEGALTRQISLNLKHTPLEDIYIQLQKEGNISDFNKAISRVFKKYLKDKDLKSKCPECKSNLSMEGGCIICKNCGYSECN
jgi:ribonucleoside-diphosphate reductase alpha chain